MLGVKLGNKYRDKKRFSAGSRDWFIIFFNIFWMVAIVLQDRLTPAETVSHSVKYCNVPPQIVLYILSYN